MLDELRQEVYEANMQLKAYSLVTLTWGNASGIDRPSGLVVIKPSGVDYDELSPENMVIVNLDGKVVEGKLAPSSDTPTHIRLYKSFKGIGGAVHTHSPCAVAFAQALRNIPILGTTHADCFYSDIPCTRQLNADEVRNNYEYNTGGVIVETFKAIDENSIPGVVAANHGPFTWGKDVKQAVHNSVVLEEIAKMAFMTRVINPDAQRLPEYIKDKHYYRKHGEKSYYGQKKG